MKWGVEEFGVYEALGGTNPAPFAGLARWNDRVVLSSSPERLVQIEGGGVQTRPIAGTHPRGPNVAADHEQLTRLLGNLKERAEHIMLIDLERNDLGRVCDPGNPTVRAPIKAGTY